MSYDEEIYKRQRVKRGGGFLAEDDPWCRFWTCEAYQYHGISEDWFPFEPFIPFDYDQGGRFCPFPVFWLGLMNHRSTDTNLQGLYEEICNKIARGQIQTDVNQPDTPSDRDGTDQQGYLVLTEQALAEASTIRDALDTQMRRGAERLAEVFHIIQAILRVWLVELTIQRENAAEDMGHNLGLSTLASLHERFAVIWNGIIYGEMSDTIDELLETIVKKQPVQNSLDGQRLGVLMHLQMRDLILKQTAPIYDKLQVYEKIVFEALSGELLPDFLDYWHGLPMQTVLGRSDVLREYAKALRENEGLTLEQTWDRCQQEAARLGVFIPYSSFVSFRTAYYKYHRGQ